MYDVKTYQTGTTIRLECVFDMEEDGVHNRFNPDYALIRIMNHRYEELEVIELDPATHSEEHGVWHYNFTIPMEEGRYIYEWEAEFRNQLVTKRNMFLTTFI